ncbi:DUF1858 domain-containing protein [Aminobacter aganoensis]|uniref:Hybrid cluster-associated redox disulfide protein n=1 Tax=Aminobacter aganoensis TaxID=83264 RepID=A0A7X0F820_9HYPH|nr:MULTISPECIES: DUF1858 domain-containing protein [Aminobacter]KQU76446.1 hypothetical protein ASC75_02175 [Aminobacter sp. DSM 101952]MBB6354797.1 hybrid cluster-associated redox disulfide protein [Aminobacter aganoensis]
MKPRFNDDMSMDAIMRQWPGTIRVMLGHGLICIGCPIASFHTVADAAREHHLDEDMLVRDLTSAMK